VNGTRRLHLYSATNERIATVQMVGNTPSRWDWTIRDASGKVLRRFSKNNANTWSWDEDYIYRDTQMLASALPADQTLYFHADHLGTPRVITNAAGNVVAQHTYYPFGAEVPTSTADAERKKFTGHERDDINLDYMHARYYMPYSGRFLSVDPVMDVKRHLRKPQGWNRYAYVENNPINLTDPTGKCPECVAASSCINCQDEIAEAVRVRSTQIEIQQMADLGDSLASEFASGNGRAEALGLGPLDAVAFGMSLRAVRAAPALRFASQASFETHFAKHGAEFGFKTAGEYLKGAAKLISSAGQKGVQSFTRANGDKVVYRAATNEFAVVTRNNVVRTFFKPKGGVEYYVRQLFAAAEEKLAKAAAQ
jgi:RHS repeat-associated protein